MPTANTVWQIAFGNYDFAVDRKTLTYRLTETENGVVWADGLSIGWLERENIATGERTRHAFGEMRLVSLSEKSGPQGKRALFGLDCDGIPVDLYFTCSQREIQLTAEASRDTRTHRIREVCLLPGLIAAPDDGASRIVLPHREGVALTATQAGDAPRRLPIWDFERGVTMPFVGAVRYDPNGEPLSSLTLITDSVYGAFHLARGSDGAARVDPLYASDPERRRLDIRLVLTPGGGPISTALAYRGKIVGERNHITLRSKARERSELDRLIGGAREADDDTIVRLSPRVASWDSMEEALAAFDEAHQRQQLVETGLEDWSAIKADCWPDINTLPAPEIGGDVIPLSAAVYHDSVILSVRLGANPQDLLRGLLYLAIPSLTDAASPSDAEALSTLHRQSFASFLTAHRFLTADRTVEEARYSNGTYVLINQSETNPFENERASLPPLGFYIAPPRPKGGSNAAELRAGGATIAIALGSNLGDREANLEFGRDELARRGVRWTAISSIYETEPVGPVADQPPFLNQVAVGETSLSPQTLLEVCLAIEQERGRIREVHWGPRTLDLDILMYGDVVIREPGLTVPHPEMANRAFVLVPLAEVAGGRVIAGIGRRTVNELLAAVSGREGVRMWRSSDTK